MGIRGNKGLFKEWGFEMSYIYSIICKICRTIEREFKESLFFTIIHTIFLFFDRQWTNSYLFKFYPSNHRINLKSRILNDDLFNPMIIILLFSLFLILLLLKDLIFQVHLRVILTFIVQFLSIWLRIIM